MIKFFRHIRQSLIMEQNKPTRYLKYAIGEIILVVFGILIALQINTWNEKRKEKTQEVFVLKSLQNDLLSDIKNLNSQINFNKRMIGDYVNCLDILANKKESTKADFMKSFETIFQVGGVNLNKTTFNNLQNNGEIKLINNKSLADSIVGYYNTNYEGWETALRDYTRNIFAPYLLEFDYTPEINFDSFGEDFLMYLDKMPNKANDFKKPEKPLEAYKDNYFIINMLRYKINNIAGLGAAYNQQHEYALNLNKFIDNYLSKYD